MKIFCLVVAGLGKTHLGKKNNWREALDEHNFVI